MVSLSFFCILVSLNPAYAEVSPITTEKTTTLEITSDIITHLQVPFIKNIGQIDDNVQFYANTFAGTMFVTNNGIVYSIPDSSNNNNISPLSKENKTFTIIRELFENTTSLNIVGIKKSNTDVNYFIGNKNLEWSAHIPTYDIVTLGTIWPGINLDLKAHGNNVEKIFTINPGANVQDIRISVQGINSLTIKDGQLLIHSTKGITTMTKPLAYQKINGNRKLVDVSYTISGTMYGFSIGNHDKNSPVIIDPLLASTFVGGSIRGAGAQEYAMVLDKFGNVYVTGLTSSTNFPTSIGAYQTVNHSTSTYGFNVQITKLSGDLTKLLASTYIGGSQADEAHGITLDNLGNVYVTGYTSSPDFPTTDKAYQKTYHFKANGDNVFISKFDSGLTTLLASTYLGGSGSKITGLSGFDSASAIVLDSSGNVYVTGSTSSDDFPVTTNGYQKMKNGYFNVFISKFDSGLTTLLASTYLGGSGTKANNGQGDSGTAIALDSSDNVYVTGVSHSSNFPVTSNSYQNTFHGVATAFVSKFDSGLTTLLASTYLGSGIGYGGNGAWSIALDKSNNVYLTGITYGDFPTTTNAFQTVCGSCNSQSAFTAFVSKFDSGLTTLLASTYLGGNFDDSGSAISLDKLGNVYVTGYTMSSTFPVTTNAYQTEGSGVFVSKLNNDLTQLIASTLIGNGVGSTLSLDNSGNVYVTGWTTSSQFPTTAGSYQTLLSSGSENIFISKLDNMLSKDTVTSLSNSSQNNHTLQQSSTSLDELLKQRLESAQKLQKLLHPQNTSSSTSVSIGKYDVADISTKYGNIVILLNSNAPKTVANFEKLANSRFYDNTIFHRIVPGFVIQGGDPNTKNGDRTTWGLGNAGYTISPEFSANLNFTKYMVGMARGSDVNSGSSQFFITVGDAPWLNDQYTLFGEVISGQDVIDKIASLPTNPTTNQPNDADAARIKTITISSNSQISPEVTKSIQQKQEDDNQKQLQLQHQIQLQQQKEDKQQQIQLQQQKLHDQKVNDETRKIISSRDEFYNANDDVHTLIFKGNAFLTANRYVDAFNYYDKALGKDSKNSDALDGKNKAYDQIHQLVSKIVDIEENTDNNNNPDSMATKGVLLAQLQDLDDSLSICNSSLQLAPENYNAMSCKLAALSGLDRYDEMNKVLQNSTSSVADLQVLYRIFTLYHLGKYDDLESYVNTLSNLAASGNSYNSIYGSSYGSYQYSSAALGFTVFKAAIAEKDGKTDLANSYYSIVIPSVGQDANTVKGSIFFLLKDYDKAIFYFDKAPYSQSVGYLKVITNDEIARQSAAYKIQHTIEHVQSSDDNKNKFCFLFWCF